jgi:hypothetical protein
MSIQADKMEAGEGNGWWEGAKENPLFTPKIGHKEKHEASDSGTQRADDPHDAEHPRFVEEGVQNVQVSDNFLTIEDHTLLRKIIEEYKNKTESPKLESRIPNLEEFENYEVGGLDLIILGSKIMFCGSKSPKDAIPQCCCGTKMQQLYNKCHFLLLGFLVKFVEYYFLVYVLQVAYHNYFLDEDDYKFGQNLDYFRAENKTFKVTETKWEEENTNVLVLSSNFILGVIFDVIVLFTLIFSVRNQYKVWNKFEMATFEWWVRFILECTEALGILVSTIFLLLPYAWVKTYNVELILNGVALLYIQEVDEGTVKLFIGECRKSILENVYKPTTGNGRKIIP